MTLLDVIFGVYTPSKEAVRLDCHFKLAALTVTGILASGLCAAQSVKIAPAERVELPTRIDGNSPSFWTEEGLKLFTSTGDPEMISLAANQYGPWESEPVNVDAQHHFPLWIEAAWRDDDGTIYGWYHNEPGAMCGSKPLTAPRIGAVVSYDGGRTITDLGIVLESGDPPDCESKNGYFAGGHGDFSVVLDRERKHFYFFFTNYAGAAESQGIVTARLAFEDRMNPAGAVWKYFEGDWAEPGLGGRVTAVFPAQAPWQSANADSYWGPAVHWNTHLESYVMLLNRSCCEEGWPQEGIYITMNGDPSQPQGWASPTRLMTIDEIGFKPGFYPQVVGVMWGETDTLAGEKARLYVHGVSDWELTFERAPEPEPATSPEATRQSGRRAAAMTVKRATRSARSGSVRR